ncbi:MAG: hypothetical protein NT154_43820 [Verrucomicrobia bacterium]|nr:hypothetical protein [Verrucomicrobiota bacterium]
MLNEGKHFLTMLEALLAGRGKDSLYLCIRDLVEHGLDLTRFAEGELRPQRQDITQYLAAWSRHAGLSYEESSAWLVEYCATLLTAISRRTPAAVRHSTKGNLRYIYRSEVPFICHGANSQFRAHCHPECPVYADMQAKREAKALEMAQPRPLYIPPAPVFVLPVKAANKEQFQTGLRFALDEVQKGTKMPRIAELLNERGLKTRTGRAWTYAILRRELQAWENTQVLQQTRDPGASPPEGSNAEGAANSGPETSVGNSGTTEGPPSMI